MTNPLTPGVYIEEISTIPPSIAAVETAIPAFIGYTEKAEENKDTTALLYKPTRITSMLEYEEIFGGPKEEIITVTVEDQLDNDNKIFSREINASISSTLSFFLYYSVKMFFDNGGGPCYIVSVGDYNATISDGDSNTGLKGGIATLEKIDEPTLLVFPDAISLNDQALYGGVVISALTLCNKLQDRFTIADVIYNEDSDPEEEKIKYSQYRPSEIESYRSALGTDYLKYGACYFPFVNTTLNCGYSDGKVTITHKENNAVASANPITDTYAVLKTSNPSIYRAIEAKIKKLYVTIPPSGAIAGVYARVDKDRGVWKAPANVGLKSVIGPTVKITNKEQDDLNVDATSGKSVNAIRTFVGKGTLIWGARTFAGNDNEWRYVPVRRFYIFVEESVKKATEFVVFEPNDANTWLRVKTMIENFLTLQWRNGALAGAKADDAFFVKVGLGQTMTALDILEGRMNIEIGMAAVRPAEFIILKFSHKLQES
ncbi:MAG: phage tail sheath family protein [Bacteroidales bacterium]|nr:phage tail sheath family protein [Bacteroidales bacterium]